jgi:hypothetical protein
MANDLPTSIRLPADLKRDLKRYAASEHRTLAAIIVYILKLWVAHKKAKP